MITPLIYFGHCIVRTSSIYGFWLLLWYILVIVLSVFRLFTTYDYSFDIFWSLYCPYFVYLRLMITPLVYFGHCIVRSASIYGFWLLLWYILVIVLSVLRLFTASGDFLGIFWSLYCPFFVYLRLLITPFGIFWSLYCLYFVYLRLLITPLVYFGHCIVRISSIYGFWLPLWYILVIVLSVLRLFMASDYSFGIFWSLYCPYFVYLRLLITPLVYFGHCIVRTSSVYGFWLLLWYILVIILSVRRLFTASDYSFGIFWSLYCPYVVYLRLMITPLIYFGHCIVRTSSNYDLWLLLWYILVIVLSVRRLFTASDYSFGIFWSLYCPCFVYLRLMITPLIYFGHCIVRISSIYDLWLLLWYILVIVLSEVRLFTLLITSLVYFGHCIVRTASIYGFWWLPWYILVIVLSVLRLFTASDYSFWYILVIVLSVLRLFTASDYSFGIFWSLYCPYFVYLRLLITPLVYFGHCIVRTSSIYGFWLLLWYILVIVLSLFRLFTASDYSFGIFWTLYCPYFVCLRLLITPLIYFGYYIVRTSSIYGFWLLLWYILVIVLSVLRLFTAYDYSFDIFWSLYCLYVVYLRLLITPLVYFGHCIVRTSFIYGFWLLLWYILVFVLSVLSLFTAFDYFFDIFWSLYCPYFVYLRLLITPLVYFGHCIVRTASIYGFWLLLWYILVIVLSVLRLLRLFTLLITPLVYFGHCIVRTSSIYGLWLLLWYILVIVLSVRRLFTTYDYSFDIFWSLYCLYVVYLRLLITPLVYVGHCIVRISSIYDLWLLLWYILVIVLSVFRLFTTYDYSFGIFWSLYCANCVYLRLLITSLVYFDHCIVRTASIYAFWWLLWYILVIVLFVLRLFTASDYSFGIFWSLYCPYFVYLRLLITPLVYFGHCIVRTSSIYGFWLLLWYILVIELSVFRLFTASDYSFGIFWTLYCPYFVSLWLLITPLIYFGYYIVRTSSIYGFWLLLWYILVIVLSVLRLFTASDYFFGIFWSLYCPYFVYLRLLITSLVYFGYYIVRTSSIYGFWLLLWYILVIVLSVLRLFTASDYSFDIFWLLYCPYVVYLRLLITPLVYFGHCIVRTSSIYDLWLLLWYILVIVLSVRRLITTYDYSFGIFWSLYCPYVVYLRLLITPLVYFGHCIVRVSSIYGLWLLLWYILVIVLSVFRLFTTYDYSFGIFWSLYCPKCVYLRFWLLLWYILVIVLSVLRLFTASGDFLGIFWSLYCPFFVYLRLLITPFGIFWSLYCPYFVYLRLLITPLVYFGHCIVRISSIYGFWLPLWYILVIVLSVLRLFMASDYSFGIFWSLYCPYFVYLRLLITPLVYFGHCIVRTSSVYGFWLLLWYILVIILSVLRLFTASDYSFGIFWSLYCPYFVYLRLMITPLIYFGHCIVRTLSIYGFWLLLWYILVIVLSVLRLFTASDYYFGIFWSLYCPYFVYLRLLITSLVYFGHCIVRTSSIYAFWLLLWYILVIVLSVLRLFTPSDYFFGIFWSLYCPYFVYLRLLITLWYILVIVLTYFVYLRLLITPLVYFGHCIVRTSSIYCFWLLLWYILVIVLSLLRLFTASDYFFGIFWSLYCLYYVYLRILITSLVYFGHCIDVLRLFTASDYSFGIFWSLYCPYVVYLLLLITSLVYFGHCIVLTSFIYGFWLLLWYILVIVLSLLRLFTASDYFFGIFWSLYCPYVVYLRLLITSLVYFDHCIVLTSYIYGLWLLLWYILVFVLSVCRLFASSDYPFHIFWSLYSPYFVYIRLLITSLAYFGHCIVRTSSINGLWLPLWYIVVIVLSVLRLFTASDYSFGILWSLYCPYCVYLLLLITPLVYFVIVLSVLRLFMAFDYSIDIFWSLYCPCFGNWRLLITSLVYFGHCMIITLSIYGYWWLLWYSLVIVLSVLCLLTASDYFFGIFWSLHCQYVVYLRFWLLVWYILVIVLSFRRLFTAFEYSFGILWSLYCPYSVYLRLLITPLVYFVMVLSVLRLFMAFDYSIGIFWSLHCPCFGNLRLLITSLVYFGHCIFRASAIYGFWLLLWYILIIVYPYFVYLRILIITLVYFGNYIVCISSIYDFWLLLWYILVIVLSFRRLFTLLITPLV